MRSLDNPYIDALVQRYRTMHGNRTVDKDDFVRGLLSAMRAGETVGILMDTNMTPPQGVFVDFFGIPACTASGLARIALRTDAAVVPGFTVWDAKLRKYILRFDPAVELIRTGDNEADIVANTAKFTKRHRRLHPPLSRPVALGPSPLEDPPRRPAATVLNWFQNGFGKDVYATTPLRIGYVRCYRKSSEIRCPF